MAKRTDPLGVWRVRATLSEVEKAPSASGLASYPIVSPIPQSSKDIAGARHSVKESPKFCGVEGANPEPVTVTSWPGLRLVDGVTMSVGAPTFGALGALGAPSLCRPPDRGSVRAPPEIGAARRAGVVVVVGAGLGAPSLPNPEAPATPDIASATLAVIPITPLHLVHRRALPTPCPGNLRIPTSPSSAAP